MVVSFNGNYDCGDAMTYDEVMDEDTMGGVDEAIGEIEEHGFLAKDNGDELLGSDNVSPPEWEFVCSINEDREVETHRVMGWLGY